METKRTETPESTKRDYNQEFRKLLLRHPKIGKPPLFGLLLRAEKLIGGEIWLVEEAIWGTIKNLGARVSDEEKEYFSQLVARLKREHTAEVLATVERVARAFNPSANEGRIQTVISNAIKTSNIKMQKPIKDEDTVKEESEEQMKGADVLQNWLNTSMMKKKQLKRGNI